MSEDTSVSICTGLVIAGCVSIAFFVTSCEQHRLSEERLQKETMIKSGYVLEPAQSERWVKKNQ